MSTSIQEAAQALIEALDGAFISSWQSTAGWSEQQEALRAALASTLSEVLAEGDAALAHRATAQAPEKGACPVCGCEEVDSRDLWTCRCPATPSVHLTEPSVDRPEAVDAGSGSEGVQ